MIITCISFLPTISHKCHLRSLLLRHVLRTGCHLCCIISEALWILGYYPLPLWLWYVLFFPDKFLWINPSPWRWPRLPQISFCWQNIMRTLWASPEEFDSNPLTISSWSHCYVTSPYDHHFVQWTPYVCPQDTSESCEQNGLMFLNPEFITVFLKSPSETYAKISETLMTQRISFHRFRPWNPPISGSSTSRAAPCHVPQRPRAPDWRGRLLHRDLSPPEAGQGSSEWRLDADKIFWLVVLTCFNHLETY